MHWRTIWMIPVIPYAYALAGQPAPHRRASAVHGMADLSDTDVLNHDPLWQLACSDARSLAPFEEARPSQATLSRLITCLSDPENLDTVHEGLLRLAIWRLNSLEDVTPYMANSPMALDLDGLPI